MSQDLIGTYWKDAVNEIFEVTEEDQASHTFTVMCFSGPNIVSESFLFNTCERLAFRNGQRFKENRNGFEGTIVGCAFHNGHIEWRLSYGYLEMNIQEPILIFEHTLIALTPSVKPTTHGPHTCKHCRTPGGLEMFSHFLCMNSSCFYYAP